MNIGHDYDDVKFIFKSPLHPRERFKRQKLVNQDQIDKKNFPQILRQKKLIQKNKNQSKDI